jgi:hypothetical protein
MFFGGEGAIVGVVGIDPGEELNLNTRGIPKLNIVKPSSQPFLTCFPQHPLGLAHNLQLDYSKFVIISPALGNSALQKSLPFAS